MKRCKSCDAELTEANQYKYKGTVRPRCRKCTIAMNNPRSSSSNAKIRLLLQVMKELAGCDQCKIKGHHSAFEFAHKDRALKSFAISHFHNLGCGIDILVAELRKVRVLCRICHAKETHDQLQSSRDQKESH